VSELKSSISTLTSPSTLTGGKSSVQTALDAVKTNVDNLAATVKSGDKPKVDALQSSITDLQKAIDDLSGSGISGMTKVATAARNVAASGQALLTALKAGCPSS
jgi:peptidoglycan hydrolase CwlO-like protein